MLDESHLEQERTPISHPTVLMLISTVVPEDEVTPSLLGSSLQLAAVPGNPSTLKPS